MKKKLLVKSKLNISYLFKNLKAFFSKKVISLEYSSKFRKKIYYESLYST